MAFYIGVEMEIQDLLATLDITTIAAEEGRTAWPEADQILPARSALELARQDLTARQRERLDFWDFTVRRRADKLNSLFKFEHSRPIPPDALDGFAVDLARNAPATVPQSHWWWREITPAETD